MCGTCAAPPALVILYILSPALTGWATVCRASSAKQRKSAAPSRYEVTTKASAGEPAGEGEPGVGADKGHACRMRHNEQQSGPQIGRMQPTVGQGVIGNA